ncbi:unnamed protein product [Brugia timori]|uniref:Uncharacterized protein n=1 Tax=Brugia timori TaxID=42155 RepID=A0A3P7V5D6_9BILA|nr:unnamed protein product [Brugia timori]
MNLMGCSGWYKYNVAFILHKHTAFNPSFFEKIHHFTCHHNVLVVNNITTPFFPLNRIYVTFFYQHVNFTLDCI